MAVVERVIKIDERIAKQLDERIELDEQSDFISELILESIHQSNKKAVGNKLNELRQNRKPSNFNATKMLQEMRNGGQYA